MIRPVEIRDVTSRVETWDPLSSTSNELFHYIDISSVDRESKQVSATQLILPSEAPSRARQIVKAGDILVSTVRPNLNAVAEIPERLDGATASTGYCVLRPDAAQIDSRFLYFWVRSSGFVNSMVKKATGASYPAVSDKIVKDSKIPLPPLPEQKRIAAILDKADSIRRKRRTVLAQLDNLSQTLFVDFQHKARTNLIEYTLVELAEKSRGSFVNGPFGSDLLTNELQDCGVPVIYIRDIRDGEYQRVSRVCVSEQKARDLAVCAVRPGDILVAKVGDPPGVAAVYSKDEPAAVITQDVIRIRIATDVASPEYVMAYLNSSIGRWKISSITVEATRARFSLGDFKKLKIELPPLSIQREFAERITKHEKLRLAHRASLSELGTLFNSLLQRAYKGEL